MYISRPTIHINGTSADALIAERAEILHHIRALTKAVQEAAPNARDYYVSHSQTFEEARALQKSRLQWLADFEASYMEECEFIEVQRK
jgi:hypothetical protein